MAHFDENDPEAVNKALDMIGPGKIDQHFRQAIQWCWMMLPKDRKTIDELETEVRRLIDRAFKDMRDDAERFWRGK